jgi:hypothetical protein
MSFQKLIQFKALSQIYGATGGVLLDQMVQQDPASVEKMKMRNVCALISVPLFERLEETCGVLSISKREFIESALIEALNQADKIINEEGVFEHFIAVTNANTANNEEKRRSYEGEPS